MKDMYGDRLNENGEIINFKSEEEIYIWCREKELDSNKIKIEYSVPGPESEIEVFPGATENGKFSIEKNYERMKKVLTKKIDDLLEKNNDNRITIIIKGHSRGGCAASRVLNEIARKYKDEENVRINTTIFDPVPGPFHSGEDVEIAIDGKVNKSAVVYCVDPVKGFFNLLFEPQLIRNIKIIIITEIDHTMGFYETEKINVNGNIKIVKKGYQFGRKRYSQGRLFELPTGIYFSEKNMKLIKITDINFKNIFLKLDKNKNATQKRLSFFKDIIIQRLFSQQIDTLSKNILNKKDCIDELCRYFTSSENFCNFIRTIKAELNKQKSK
ncbi:MAG: hypothetical protein RsTaC01_0455 [Candidatus Paraimprobicoccus trichonymphae]|uniref:Uncharacterized protein n=1 Tax=Candidatus Paraimprobicoccus trichonymphae TaxID=3033793 RepID=A0AA48KZ80_9FIRM|nr:MAG: hypothetical protein RsTaC01_0455 [Candidatus Paraimprobicoccus trichonymphae]